VPRSHHPFHTSNIYSITLILRQRPLAPMRLPSSLILFLMAVAPITTSATPSHAIKRLHNLALKHSSGLARNLRSAFEPILVAQPANSALQRKLYCVSYKATSQVVNGSISEVSSKRPTSTGGSNATRTSTSASSTPTQTASSRFKLIESHVRYLGCLIVRLGS
jgi:hypothetical protein